MSSTPAQFRDHLTSGTEPPCLDGPINSIRWENLRDGLEDYEYLWLFQQAVAPDRALLTVPEAISLDLTHFTTDPRLLLAHRARLALELEARKSK